MHFKIFGSKIFYNFDVFLYFKYLISLASTQTLRIRFRMTGDKPGKHQWDTTSTPGDIRLRWYTEVVHWLGTHHPKSGNVKLTLSPEVLSAIERTMRTEVWLLLLLLYPSQHYPSLPITRCTLPDVRLAFIQGYVMRLINNEIRNQKLNECPFVIMLKMTMMMTRTMSTVSSFWRGLVLWLVLFFYAKYSGKNSCHEYYRERARWWWTRWL